MAEPSAAPKKVSKPKKAPEHPPFKLIVVEAIAALKEVRRKRPCSTTACWGAAQCNPGLSDACMMCMGYTGAR
jgi:hypothetical protein